MNDVTSSLHTDEMPEAEPKVWVPAELIKLAAVEGCRFFRGHTDGNPYYLATGNVPTWGPTFAEMIGRLVEMGGQPFYSGPDRPEDETPGKWKTKNIAKGEEVAVVRGWYYDFPRIGAPVRHALGCDPMGWELGDAVAVWQPGRDDLYKVSVAVDPEAMARSLATAPAKKQSKAADGLKVEERRALDRDVRAILEKARRNGKWGGALSDLTDDYTPVAILASVRRLTDGDEDSGQWVAAMAAVLRRDDEPAADEPKAEEPAPEPPAEPAADQS